jgi:hypothetical protein
MVGLKQVAFDIDINPSALNHAIAERDRHYLRGEWLLYFVAKAPDSTLADLLVRPGNRETKPIAKLTPEQELTRLKSALDKNPAIARAIYDEAGL